MKYYSEEEYLYPKTEQPQLEFGCGFCWDKKRNQEKELFFLDKANNMRICHYCPSCGRKFNCTED